MRILALFLGVCFALLSLSCGGDERFVDATLADAMSGAVPSKTDAYRLASPEIVVVKGDFALLRDGRVYQILTADGFDEIYPRIEGSGFKLLVRKWQNPYPHLRLEGYELGEERVETEWVLGESDLPTLVEHRLYDVSFYEKTDPASWPKKLPDTLADKKIWLTARLEAFQTDEEMEEPEEEEEPAVPGADDEDGEGEEPPAAEAEPDTGMVSRAREVVRKGPFDRFAIHVAGRKFNVHRIREDGIVLLLKGIAAEKETLPIGGFITEVYPARRAAEEGIAGTFKLEIFDFGGKYVLERR
ncbi:MAG: hypothetical protein ABIH26_07755 [Candidatus Eisenbacteria bacterium]